MKINFHRVLLGFFENWDKSPQKKWDKGEANAALLFYEVKWYNCVVMKMDDYKNSDNFQRVEGSKMISPHLFHPTNGVRPSDSLVDGTVARCKSASERK